MQLTALSTALAQQNAANKTAGSQTSGQTASSATIKADKDAEAAKQLQAAKDAAAQLAQFPKQRSDAAKAAAKQKVEQLKQMLQQLRLMAASDPKHMGPLMAQMAKQLAAAAKDYVEAGGSSGDLGDLGDLGGSTDTATPTDTTANTASSDAATATAPGAPGDAATGADATGTNSDTTDTTVDDAANSADAATSDATDTAANAETSDAADTDDSQSAYYSTAPYQSPAALEKAAQRATVVSDAYQKMQAGLSRQSQAQAMQKADDKDRQDFFDDVRSIQQEIKQIVGAAKAANKSKHDPSLDEADKKLAEVEKTVSDATNPTGMILNMHA